MGIPLGSKGYKGQVGGSDHSNPGHPRHPHRQALANGAWSVPPGPSTAAIAQFGVLRLVTGPIWPSTLHGDCRDMQTNAADDAGDAVAPGGNCGVDVARTPYGCMLRFALKKGVRSGCKGGFSQPATAKPMFTLTLTLTRSTTHRGFSLGGRSILVLRSPQNGARTPPILVGSTT